MKGKRCAITAALLAGCMLLAGCGATVDINEEQLIEPDIAVRPGAALPQGEMSTDDAARLFLAAMLMGEESGAFNEMTKNTLDDFCAAQSGHFSVYLHDLDRERVYTYGADAAYYAASTLKAPFGLWLCQRADAGEIDFNQEIPNWKGSSLYDSILESYADAPSIPAYELLDAMLSHSDNDATDMLSQEWASTEEFQQFLADLGYTYPESCSIDPINGIEGMTTVTDSGKAMEALYAYLESDAPHAELLRSCMDHADHEILYIPEGVPVIKKYGSWDGAFHDMAIVYGKHPYIICCMTDQGNQEVSFPEEPVAVMQKLGKLADKLMRSN